MHDLSVAGVDSHMTRVADNITGLRILKTVYSRAYVSVRRRRMRQIHAEVLIYAHDKP